MDSCVMTGPRLLLNYIPWDYCYNHTRYLYCRGFELISVIGSPLNKRMSMQVYEMGYSPQTSRPIATSMTLRTAGNHV